MKQKNQNNSEATAANGATVTSNGVEADNSTFASLSASLAEIRKLEGVIGYILRSKTSALVDMAESDKISPYALFSNQMQECCSQVTHDFSLGEPESMILEGENVKVLCMNLEDNNIDVFMEKNTSHNWIIKRILL